MVTAKYLIVYDVKKNQNRYQLVKIIEGFGIRVQKSAFEANLSKDMCSEMISRCKHYITPEDSLRIYRINDNLVYTNQTKKAMCSSALLWL